MDDVTLYKERAAEFGGLLTKYRLAAGYGRGRKKAFSEAIGLKSQSGIKEFEDGKRPPTMELLGVMIVNMNITDAQAEDLRDRLRWLRASDEGRVLIEKERTERRTAAGNQGKPTDGGVGENSWGDRAQLRDVVRVPVIPRYFKGDDLEVAMNEQFVDAQGCVGPYVPVARSVAEAHGSLLAFMIEGDEGQPRLAHGGHVVAAVEEQPVPGEAVLVCVDGEVSCRIWREDGEDVILKSVNPRYEDKRLKRSAITWVFPIVGSWRPGL